MNHFRRKAIIDHFVTNFKETPDVYAFAKKRIFEVDQLFKAMDEDGKPKERTSTDRSKEIRIELNALNRKAP